MAKICWERWKMVEYGREMRHGTWHGIWHGRGMRHGMVSLCVYLCAWQRHEAWHSMASGRGMWQHTNIHFSKLHVTMSPVYTMQIGPAASAQKEQFV